MAFLHLHWRQTNPWAVTSIKLCLLLLNFEYEIIKNAVSCSPKKKKKRATSFLRIAKNQTVPEAIRDRCSAHHLYKAATISQCV